MGSLAAHVFNGCCFVVYGLVWCVLSISFQLTPNEKKTQNSYDLTKKTALVNEDLHRKSWLPVFLFPRFPLEPILKIALPAAGIFIEAFLDYRTDENGDNTLIIWRVYRIYDEHGVVWDQGKLNHITMLSTFLLSGIVDLLTLFVKFPALTSKFFLSLAFFVQLIIAYMHSHGRSEFNALVHSFSALIILLCLIFSLMRFTTSSNLFINLGLGSSILLQGTWLIQIGYFLFGGFMDVYSQGGTEHEMSEHEDDEPNTHGLHLFFLEAFAWHIQLIIVGNLVLWVILSLVIKKSIFSIRRNAAEVSADELECTTLMGYDHDENNVKVHG